MASNKMATLLAYAALEWILILLLFLNSFLSHFITKFTNHFGLKPCCPFCTYNINLDLVCKAHHGGTQILSEEDDESVYLTDMLLHNAVDSDRFICIELNGTETLQEFVSTDADNSQHFKVEGEEEFVSKDRFESIVKAMNAELEEERKAAKEAMAMITKLKEENCCLQIEALHYQRMMEEQAEYDQEALQLLNHLVTKREKEKQQLEKELEMYRNEAVFEYKEDVWNMEEEEEDDDDDDLGEERVSILEEFKALEAKLIALHNNEMYHSCHGVDEEMETMEEASHTRFTNLTS